MVWNPNPKLGNWKQTKKEKNWKKKKEKREETDSVEPQPKIGKLETLPIYCFHSDQRSWTDPQGLQMTIFDKILTLSLTVCIFFVQLCELNLEFCKNGCKS